MRMKKAGKNHIFLTVVPILVCLLTSGIGKREEAGNIPPMTMGD